MEGGYMIMDIYWNCTVNFSGPVIRYEGGSRKMVRMSVLSSYNDLKNLIMLSMLSRHKLQ